MDQISSVLISKALDGLWMRSMYTAQNIANVNSLDYKPVKVSFEDSLKAAASNDIGALESVSPKTTYGNVSSNSSNMRLDLQLATASQTAMRYDALINILGRQIAMTRSVVSGGQ